MTHQKRKPAKQLPFHVFIESELHLILTSPRNKDTADRAFNIAYMIRNVKCPKNAGDVLVLFKGVMEHIGGVKNDARFTTAERSVFYSARDMLSVQAAEQAAASKGIIQPGKWAGDVAALPEPAMQEPATAVD